jgi:hypothetical protein
MIMIVGTIEIESREIREVIDEGDESPDCEIAVWQGDMQEGVSKSREYLNLLGEQRNGGQLEVPEFMKRGEIIMEGAIQWFNQDH